MAVNVSTSVAAQEPFGALMGVVRGPDGTIVAEAPIRVRNEASGIDARTFSSTDGHYEVQDLPNGTFSVTIQMPCCAFAPYRNDEVVLDAGERFEFNIRLEEGASIGVLADDPGLINAEIRNRQVIPDLPVPRTVDGTPDLSGLWLIRGDPPDPFPDPPPAQPWAQEIFQQRIANSLRDAPHTRCLPPDPSRPGNVAPFMSKLVQTSDLLVILFEDVPGFRQVFLDGRDHPQYPNPTWMGHSIGYWEGDSLVVDTDGYMDVRVTVNDPEVFTSPWVRNLRLDLAPQGDR